MVQIFNSVYTKNLDVGIKREKVLVDIVGCANVDALTSYANIETRPLS